ncbi:MAG TPA: MFS transporter [Clostridia bacterium]|nr:MFS transporter [Clostridia bacterium]
MHQNQTTGLWNSSYILILIISALTAIGFNMITPILAKYVIDLGATVVLAGVIAGMFSITALFARPFAGFSSDKFNKKTLLIMSTVLLAVSTLCYGMTQNVYVLFLFRIIHGIAFAFSGTANTSLCTAFIPADRMGEGIGFMGLSFILSSAVGPNLGIMISGWYGYKYVFYASSAIIILAAFLMNLIKYVPSGQNVLHNKDLKLKAGNLIAKELLIFSVLAGFFSFTNGLISSFLVLLGDERHITGIGYYFTVNALMLLFVRPLSGKLLDRKGLAFIAFPAYILAIIAAILLGTASALWMVLLAGMFYALGQGSCQPAIQVTCVKKLGPERVGVATSTYFIGADVGQGLGPIIGGATAESFGFGAVFCSSGIMLLFGLIIFYLYIRSEKNRVENAKVGTTA